MTDKNIQERLDDAVCLAETTTQKFSQILNGSETETVVVLNGEVPSVAKTIKDIRSEISTGVNDIITISTEAKNTAVSSKEAILNNEGFIAVSHDLLNDNNITTTALNINSINAVALIDEAVTKVSSLDPDAVIDVASVKDNIPLLASNITDIQNAGLNAENAKTSAQNALASEQAAHQSALQAAASANLSDATETTKGVLKIASLEEALLGTNTVKAMTPKTVKDVCDVLNQNLNTHSSSTTNPHQVTKSQLGLENVENTSDLNKPISTATEEALNAKAVKDLPVTVLSTSGTISLTDNSINRITPTGTVSFVLPVITDNTIFHQILVQIKLTSIQTINLGTSVYFGGEAFEFEVGSYNLIFEHDGTNWVVGAISKGS